MKFYQNQVLLDSLIQHVYVSVFKNLSYHLLGWKGKVTYASAKQDLHDVYFEDDKEEVYVPIQVGLAYFVCKFKDDGDISFRIAITPAAQNQAYDFFLRGKDRKYEKKSKVYTSPKVIYPKFNIIIIYSLTFHIQIVCGRLVQVARIIKLSDTPKGLIFADYCYSEMKFCGGATTPLIQVVPIVL